MPRRESLISIGDIIADIWRCEIKNNWPLRRSSWRRELIRQYLALIRLREDKRPDRIVGIYRKSRDL